MIRRLASDSCGMTLIELLIVLAVIGLTASIAGVYISSGNTQVRTTLRNLRFDLVQAKAGGISQENH